MTLAKKFLLLTCILPIALAPGCTGTDVLSTGNTDFTIDVEIVNATTRFTTAQFKISAINIRPNGVESDAALGSAPIGIIATPANVLEVNLRAVTDFTPTTIQLSTGSYRINRIEFSGLLFNDNTQPRPAPTCAQVRLFEQQAPIPVFAAQLGNPNITVVAGGQSSATIRIDGQAFATAFQQSFSGCSLSTSTASGFSQAAFASQAPTFVTIQ